MLPGGSTLEAVGKRSSSSITTSKSGSCDRSVQATNDDATVSKLSCAKMGYFKDDFVKLFVRRSAKRSPVIHRGYFARWAALRKLLDQFLDAGQKQQQQQQQQQQQEQQEARGPGRPHQILSLGAGFDTLYFVLQSEGRLPTKFIEVDFKEVTAKKVAIIASKPELSSCLSDPHPMPEWHGVDSQRYALVAADLRDDKGLTAALAAAGADFSLPTLILAECVLIYMDPEASDSLVKWVADTFSDAAFVVYEQIRPDDAFGQQMVQNLEARGCPLLGLSHTPTLESKEDRFLRHGFAEAEAVDMDVLYGSFIDQELVHRIERLEIFDEFEEWHMMQEHYCIAYGIKATHTTDFFQQFGFHMRRRRAVSNAHM